MSSFSMSNQRPPLYQQGSQNFAVKIALGNHPSIISFCVLPPHALNPRRRDSKAPAVATMSFPRHSAAFSVFATAAAPRAPPPAYGAVGPFCPLLTTAGLRAHAELLPPAIHGAASRALLRMAREQVKGHARAQAEWTYARAMRAARRRGSAGDAEAAEAAEAAFALALVVQRRDVELARYAFRLSASACNKADDGSVGKVLVSWGLFESKQPGGRQRAQRLLKRAVQMDPSRAPVLKWKCLFE